MACWRTLLCALAAASALLAGPGAVAAEPAAPATPALWVARNGAATVYLFGTIHVLAPGARWLEGDVEAAFGRSNELVLELVLPTPEAARAAILRRALAPGAAPVPSRLPGRSGDAYVATLASLGLPADAFDPFHAWFAAVTLTTAAAQQAGYGVAEAPEFVLTRAAEASGKTIVGLETFDGQLALLGSMPEPLQARFLAVTVAQMPDAPKTLAAMVGAWAAGDVARLAGILDEGLSELPDAKELLLTQRNARWARWVADRLQRPGTVFVAVGAGHLAGPESVQAELAKLGVQVERVGR